MYVHVKIHKAKTARKERSKEDNLMIVNADFKMIL